MAGQKPEEIGLTSHFDDERDSIDDLSHDEEDLVRMPARPGLHERLPSFVRPTASRLNAVHVRYLCAAVAVFIILGWLFVPSGPKHGRPKHHKPPPPHLDEPLPLTRPEDTKIIGLVFYGRRDRSSILDCYLRNNLRSNGGWLNEVAWGVNTDNEEDLAYLDLLVGTTPEYRKVKLREKSYVGLWEETIEAGNIYVKLDDDVVFIDDDAIPRIVDTLLTHSESVIVSANIINSPKLSWLQYRTGAILPYLPELGRKQVDGSLLSSRKNPLWRASDLPFWKKPDGFEEPKKIADWENYFKSETSTPDDLPKHRWLPVEGQNVLYHTPISQTEFKGGGNGLYSWAIAAQQHYSFLDHLEKGRKFLYTLSHGSSDPDDTIWDMTGERLSINFIALRGETILENLDKLAEWKDDEEYLTVELPKQLNKRLTIQTKALAVHYSFNKQHTLDHTDVLARYRAYAMENACPGDFLDPAS
jgi:hypothetical protein